MTLHFGHSLESILTVAISTGAARPAGHTTRAASSKNARRLRGSPTPPGEGDHRPAPLTWGS